MRSDDLRTLPTGLPTQVDDGACDHLQGSSLPNVELRSTAGRIVELAARFPEQS